MTGEPNELGQIVGPVVNGWLAAQFPSTEPMVGEYCRVERLDPEHHAAPLFEANNTDPTGANWTYLPYGPYPELDEYRAWVASAAATDDPMFFAVVDHSTGQAIGVTSFLRISIDDGSIEVGNINYSPLLQRTRMGTEAMYLMMVRAFDDWGYRRYEWKCNALNAPSMAAARRLGFTYEGTHRKAKVVKGRNRDTAWFSITDDEWGPIKQRFLRWLDPTNFDEAGRQLTPLATKTTGTAPS